MKLKKLAIITIILSFVFLNISPVLALSKKEIKSAAEKEKHLEYINLAWWENFNDDYLTEYILKAIVNNPDAKIATLKVEETRQKMKLQLSNEFPALYVGASPSLAKMPGVTNTQGFFALPVIASYEIDIFLKNRDKTRSVKKLYEASKFSEKATYISIAAAVGSTYYNIVRTDELIDLQKQIVEHRKKIYDLKQLSYNQGIVSMSDLIIAEKQFINSEIALSDLQKAKTTLLTTLAVLTGDSPSNISNYQHISYENLKLTKPIPDVISSDVIMNRPDYLIAEKMLEKAGIDVRVAKKEFLPSFNIIGFMAFLSSSEGMAFNYQNALGALALSSLYPIFTGGKRIANFKLNKNQYLQAIENYQKTNLTSVKEVDDALTNLKFDYEKYQKTKKTFDIEAKNYKLCEAKFKQGTISQLELLEKEESLLYTKRLLATNNIDNFINHINLYKATAAK